MLRKLKIWLFKRINKHLIDTIVANQYMIEYRLDLTTTPSKDKTFMAGEYFGYHKIMNILLDKHDPIPDDIKTYF